MNKKNKKSNPIHLNNEYELVYSTNQNAFNYLQEEEEEEKINTKNQNLYIYIDKKNRCGKTVTIIEGFSCKYENLLQLEKELKKLCCSGGSIKDNKIIIQGNFKEKIKTFLQSKGYKITLK
ncbi:MAG: translation initiation factor [Bacteroidales bacterium]|nr:translation initiation factor [Bacteroidales bacterium]